MSEEKLVQSSVSEEKLVESSVSKTNLVQPSVSDEMKLVHPLVHEC